MSSDKILLGEISLHGGFHQLQEKLFLRREHPDSSVRAHPGVVERNQWFDTEASAQEGFIRWRWVGEYLRGIQHAPIGPVEKVRCAGVVWEHVQRDREKLKAELKRPLRRLVRRQPKMRD
jgi:hypothetical protein